MSGSDRDDAECAPSADSDGRPDGLPPLRDVIRELGLTARKSLGQNYILDLNLTRRIARTAAPLQNRHIIEVGPGPGGLTRGLLLEGAAHVTAVEKDPRFRPALEAVAAAFPGRLTILDADATAIDWSDLAGPETWIVANLPYNVGTQLLLDWLTVDDWPPFWGGLVLMFQREVAERIAAAPGTKAYGRLSVLADWRCDVRIDLHVPAAAFTPPPKVASALVRLTPRSAPREAGSARHLARVTAAAFGQRRKMLRQSLKPVFADPQTTLDTAGIPATARAETVDTAGFCTLARLSAEEATKS